jgi:hypothetical protein
MSGDYIYQPNVTLRDYDSAVAAMRVRYPRLRSSWVNPGPHLDAIARRFDNVGMPAQQMRCGPAEYRSFLESASYATLYPNYYTGTLAEKSFEHFIALRLLQPGLDDVLIDIASEGSPLPEIASRLFGCKAYAQDIMYPAGVEGQRIGGDACCMPVSNGFATCAALTCSLEHFEGDADTRLFQEMARVLRPGGKVVVVPLYMFTEAAIQTDPTYTCSLDIPFDPDATLYCAKGWGNRHGRFYTPETLRTRIVRQCPNMTFTVFRLFDTESLDAAIYARFCLVGTRT